MSIAWGFFKGPKRIPDVETLEDAQRSDGTTTRRARSCETHGVFQAKRRDDQPREHRQRLRDRPRRRGDPQSLAADFRPDSRRPIKSFRTGSPPGDFAGSWKIALRNPFDPETPLGTLRLRDRGLGTSGTAFQRFEVAGRVFGHILDPRTGEPASGPASVTVLAPSATEADALSTAFYLLGPNASAQILERRPDIAAIFVEDGPSLRGFNLGEEDFEANEEIFIRT